MSKVRVRFGAEHEESATTTSNVPYVPKPFAGPWSSKILTKGHVIDPEEVKARERCMKAMRAYTAGEISKEALNRICKE